MTSESASKLQSPQSRAPIEQVRLEHELSAVAVLSLEMRIAQIADVNLSQDQVQEIAQPRGKSKYVIECCARLTRYESLASDQADGTPRQAQSFGCKDWVCIY